MPKLGSVADYNAVSVISKENIMKQTNVKKLALAAVLTAVAVVGSLLSFPIFGSRCSPVQHMVNILCAVLLDRATV